MCAFGTTLSEVSLNLTVTEVGSGYPHDAALLATVKVQGNLARLPVKQRLVDRVFEIVGHRCSKGESVRYLDGTRIMDWRIGNRTPGVPERRAK
jgi:hypothetical protein